MQKQLECKEDHAENQSDIWFLAVMFDIEIIRKTNSYWINKQINKSIKMCVV